MDTNNKPYYLPIMLRCNTLNVTIIGGGKVALRKAKRLAGKTASITVIAPEILKEFYSFNHITIKKQKYKSDDLNGVNILYVAVNDSSLRDQIFKDLKSHPDILANFVDCQKYCDFVTPAIIERENLTIAVSSQGTAPSEASKLKEKIKEMTDIPYWENRFKITGEKRKKC